MMLEKLRVKAQKLYRRYNNPDLKVICTILNYDNCIEKMSCKEAINILYDLGYNEDEAIFIYMELLKEIC